MFQANRLDALREKLTLVQQEDNQRLLSKETSRAAPELTLVSPERGRNVAACMR